MFGFYSKKWQNGVAFFQSGVIIKPVPDCHGYNEYICVVKYGYSGNDF